jgi:protein TonB
VVVHGAFFVALASAPAAVEPSAITRAIEFITISDDGGGRLGDDEQVGDAAAPTEPPERLFREVEPKRARRKPVVEAKRKPAKPEPAIAETSDPAKSPATDGVEAGATRTASHSMMSGSAGRDPNATASGVGSGGQGVDRRAALRAWLSEVQREVNKIATRNYPSSAVRMKLEGRLRLGVTIGEDGRILAVRVLSSSGHSVLDESATASVTELRIPAPPEALHWRQREISLPIRYALQ